MAMIDENDSRPIESPRTPSFPLGTHRLTISKIFEHTARDGGPGVVLEGYIDGELYGGRRAGSKKPDLKHYLTNWVLTVAAEVFGLAYGTPELDKIVRKAAAGMLDPQQQKAEGREVEIHVTTRKGKDGKDYPEFAVRRISDSTPAAKAAPPVAEAVMDSAPEIEAPPVAATFPPEGWTQHPKSPTHYYKGKEVLTEAQLRARA